LSTRARYTLLNTLTNGTVSPPPTYMGETFTNKGESKMKNNYLHTGNTTKKSSARARPVFGAFGVVAAVTLAGVALAAGPEHRSVRSSKSQIVAENPDASNNQGIAMSGKNPIAEKYNTLVMRVYFRDRAARDRLAQELSAKKCPQQEAISP